MAPKKKPRPPHRAVATGVFSATGPESVAQGVGSLVVGRKMHAPHLAASVIQKVMRHFLSWRHTKNAVAFRNVFKGDPKRLDEIKKYGCGATSRFRHVTFGHGMIGLILEGANGDEIVVKDVRQKSAAHIKGLQKGDRVVSFNGIKIDSSTTAKHLKTLMIKSPRPQQLLFEVTRAAPIGMGFLGCVPCLI
mmetsp:Transcript_66442/g.183565  ORF Transcript_66442/g.183565 Transcript_66442/m.183565 type:complete len:191 (-) Transcript_66442:203-775(-)